MCISARGAVTFLGGRCFRGQVPKGGARGAIEGFSTASSRRLRRLLVERDGPAGWEPWAVTLTVPGPVLQAGEWRELWHRYRVRLARAGLLMVWRVELQRRGQPHVHAIAWGPRRGRESFDGLQGVGAPWYNCIRGLGPVVEHVGLRGKVYRGLASRMSIPGAYRVAFKGKCEDGRRPDAWWKYLAAHTAKQKRDQLGWAGRQWGVIGRGLLRRAPAVREPLGASEYWRLRGLLRRLTGYRGATLGVTVWYVRQGTASRMLAWARENPRGKG